MRTGTFTHLWAVDPGSAEVHVGTMRRGPTRRGWALGVPGVALATAGGVWVQAQRVANAPLPHFEDLDPSGRYGDAPGPQLRLVALGDSSMTGPGLTDAADTWIARVAGSLSSPVELISLARGGSRVRDVITDQLDRAIELRPDLYVVSVGANDAMHGTPSPVVRRQLGSVLTALEQVAPVVALGIGDLSVIPRLPRSLRTLVSVRSAAIDRAHRSATRGRPSVLRIPVSELSDPHFRAAGSSLFSPDLFHPNAEGHRLWSSLFTPFVAAAMAVQHDVREDVVDIRANAGEAVRCGA